MNVEEKTNVEKNKKKESIMWSELGESYRMRFTNKAYRNRNVARKKPNFVFMLNPSSGKNGFSLFKGKSDDKIKICSSNGYMYSDTPFESGIKKRSRKNAVFGPTKKIEKECWTCSSCLSINELNDKRCYMCFCEKDVLCQKHLFSKIKK